MQHDEARSGGGILRRAAGFAFPILVVVFALLVLADPAADPPMGPTDFEGQILLGALPGPASPDTLRDEWSPRALVPTQVGLTSLAFRILEPSLVTARRLSAVAAILVLVLFHRLVRRSGGEAAALVASVFLAFNPVFFGVARTALPAVFSLLWMLLAVEIWIRGERSRLLAGLGGGAVVWAGLVENGVHGAFFLGAGLFMMLFLRLHAWKMPWLDATRQRLGSAVFGAVVVGGILLLRVISQWEAFGSTWGHLSSFGPRMIVPNLVTAPLYFAELTRFMPVLVLVALASFLFHAKDAVRPVARHRRLDEVSLWFLGWLVSGAVFFATAGTRPLDALVLLVPPMCAVAAEGVVRLFRMRRISRPRIDVMIVITLIAGVNWGALTWAVHALLDFQALGGALARHQIMATLFIVAVLWLLTTPALTWLYLRWKRHVVTLRPGPVIATAVILGLAVPVLGTVPTARWWASRTHDVRAASEALSSDLPDDAFVVGSWAPLLTLSRPVRATVIWRDVNDEPLAWHDEITHLLLQEGRESSPGLPPRSILAERGVRIAGGPRTEYRIGEVRIGLYPVSGASALEGR